MSTLTRLLLLTLIATLPVPAQWRIRRAETDDRRPPVGSANQHRHYLLPDELADSVAALGGSVLARIPGAGVVATLPPGVSRAEVIDSQSKISAELLEDRTPVRHFLVEFFPDVEPAERELIVIRAGLVVRSRPDLSPAHLLVEGPFRKLTRLAQRDEVAYIFPASEDLVRGEPAYACLNSAAGAAGTGQYIPTVGDGWDGPGLGSASLNYSFEKLTDRLPADTVRQILARAMAEWSKAAQISFSEGTSTRTSRNVNILFAGGAHGDSYPFDGPGMVLAHTFYPSPAAAEPLAGDMHLDAGEAWHQGADIDLFSVVLHELGHALGLGHADSPNAVMYPYYRRVSTLSTADIAAIQMLYAAPGAVVAPPPPATPPTTPPAPVTPPATDDRTAPTVAITSIAASTYTTTRASLSLTGVAADNLGVTEVRWSTNTGASGVAAGTAAWSTAEIPLLIGYNVITVRAYDAAGNSGWRAIGVTRR